MKKLAKLSLVLITALSMLAFGACSDGGDDDPVCGNGQVEVGETCDGNCPTSCDDNDPCTTDTLSGSADECTAICSFTPITECADDDGCCPDGCTEADDNDCTGDPCEGVTACIDDDGCCPNACDHTTDNDCVDPCAEVTECVAGDGCCPDGCDFSTDNDCPDPCADVTECIDDDGCCPEGCTDATDNDCEPDPCADVTECIDDDGCCPEGCTDATDNDCEPVDPCEGVTECIDDDGCCPDGCTDATDNDCEPVDPCEGVTECIDDDGCCPAACTPETDNDCVDPCEGVTECLSGDGCCPDGCAFPDDLDCDFTCTTIADLRLQADGPLDTPIQMCPAYVTYLANNGFFMQTEPEGPAIFSYEGYDWNADGLLGVGDSITLAVGELGTYNGLKQIAAHEGFQVISLANNIDFLIQDLSAGTVPTEDHESELVLVTGAEVTALDAGDITISYGTASDVLLYASDVPGNFCLGATFDFLGPVSDYNGIQLRSYYVEDFSNIDTSNCASLGRAPVAGDLVLNEFLADPPNGPAGDANCDGTRNGTEDEFVEIVNVSGEDLDLSAVTIADDTAVKFTFLGFGLPAGGVVVVFGGGAPACTWETNVQVLTVGGNGLGLNNGGDSITLALPDGTELLSYAYGAEGDNNESLTLDPDITGTNYVGHTAATGAVGNYSPGTAVDGSALAP